MIVLDTHALVWLDQDIPLLGPRSRDLADVALAEDRLAVCAISFWEVAMLAGKGRIAMSLPVADWRRDLLAAGLRELPVDGAVGIGAALLEGLHPDPADRSIVAATLAVGGLLVTADQRLLGWSGPLGRQDARG